MNKYSEIMNKYSEMLPAFIVPKSEGKHNTVKRPPAWSLKDFSEHLKIPISTLQTRSLGHPLPQPISMTLKGNSGKPKNPCKLYSKQALINWNLTWIKNHGKI